MDWKPGDLALFLGGHTAACAAEHGRRGSVRALIRILQVGAQPPAHLPGHTIYARSMRHENETGYVMPEEIEPPDWDSLPANAEKAEATA
ncbi:MAG: hypothetical protein FJ318_08065 [SAR202 cluster bacterium]|nr:hypothetical protein [SAR202 cluster bacterium]